jgi:hypothetical protein
MMVASKHMFVYGGRGYGAMRCIDLQSIIGGEGLL